MALLIIVNNTHKYYDNRTVKINMIRLKGVTQLGEKVILFPHFFIIPQKIKEKSTVKIEFK
jgi:hypothetical protein